MTSPTTATPAVTRTDDDGLATITLRNPGLSGRSRAELTDAFRAVAQDSPVRAVVLTGSGRAFCVGQDLAEHAKALRASPARAWLSSRRRPARCSTQSATKACPSARSPRPSAGT